jgi:hypothetical protein
MVSCDIFRPNKYRESLLLLGRTKRIVKMRTRRIRTRQQTVILTATKKL